MSDDQRFWKAFLILSVIDLALIGLVLYTLKRGLIE